MARTTEQLLAQLLAQLPPEYETMGDLLSGVAAAMRAAELTADTLFPQATIEGGTGKWLTLHGAGLGVHKTPGESDASLRIRIRDVENKVTRPAILALVDQILLIPGATMVEHFEGPFLDDLSASGFFLDGTARLSGGPNSFIIEIPDQGGPIGPGQPDVYNTIVAAVDRIRAADTFWRLSLAP